MKARKDVYQTAMAVVIIAVMLAVPFSCLIAKAVLWWLEPWRSGDGLGVADPVGA